MKRKLVISGLALIAAVATVSGATYALFTSTVSTPDQSVAAGTINLEFANVGLSNSVVGIPFNVTNAKPGDTGTTKYLTVKNTGSLPATVAVKIKKISDNDNDCNATEQLVDITCGDGQGELDENLNLFVNGWVGVGDVLESLEVGQSALVRDMEGTQYDSTFVLDAGATSSQRSVGWSIPASVGNVIQSDSVSFQIVLEATQIPAA